jgi:hypothetical protein
VGRVLQLVSRDSTIPSFPSSTFPRPTPATARWLPSPAPVRPMSCVLCGALSVRRPPLWPEQGPPDDGDRAGRAPQPPQGCREREDDVRALGHPRGRGLLAVRAPRDGAPPQLEGACAIMVHGGGDEAHAAMQDKKARKLTKKRVRAIVVVCERDGLTTHSSGRSSARSASSRSSRTSSRRAVARATDRSMCVCVMDVYAMPCRFLPFPSLSETRRCDELRWSGGQLSGLGQRCALRDQWPSAVRPATQCCETSDSALRRSSRALVWQSAECDGLAR